MAINDMYLLRDMYELAGEQMQNVYYYEQTTSSGNAQDLAEGFRDEVLPLILAIQSNQVTHTTIQAENRNDPTDFFILSLTTSNVGNHGGDFLPKFNAWGFQINRSATQRRHGAKRIGGVYETGVENPGVPTAAAQTNLDSLAATLAMPVPGGSGSFVLRIPSGSFAGGAVPIGHPHSGVTFKRLTTQNSRKR